MAETVTKPLLLNETGEKMVSALQSMAISLARNDAADLSSYTPRQVQTIVRMGEANKYFDTTMQIVVSKESSIALTCSTGSASIDDQAFVDRIGHAKGTVYEFRYDGTNWVLEDGTNTGTPVSLAEYGITYSGTPTEGATISATETVEDLVFDILQPDGYDHPSNTELTHAMSLGLHDCETFGTIPFDRPEALFYVNPTDYPDGLTAGTKYTVTIDHGANNNATTQDGTYGFTPTKDVPAGGLVRHTTMGNWYANTEDYTTDKVVAGKFVTYDESYSQLESLDTELVTDGSGTSLGTTTSETKSYKTSDNLNYTKRNAYGDNKLSRSAARQWLNSKLAGAASGAIASWWKSQGIFDMPVYSTIPGFLHGVDPEFLAVIGKVKKRTGVHKSDTEAGTATSYEDTDELVFLQSMTEVGLGTNDGVVETSPDADGNVVNAAYQYWIDNSSAEDRIKYYNKAARVWWLRGCSPWHVNLVRGVSASGALGNYSASGAYGLVPSLNIV